MKEETGVDAEIINMSAKSQYSFTVPEDVVEKRCTLVSDDVGQLMQQPQREEYFTDSGYKFHEAYHLLKFPNEKAEILEKAYSEYLGDRRRRTLENRRK